MDRKDSLSYIDTLLNVIIAGVLFFLPLFFLTNTTDFFTIPKQLLIVFATSALLIIWGLRVIIARKVIITNSPLNVPLILFFSAVVISSIVSRSRLDSLIQTIPVLFAILFSFVIVNSVRDKRAFSVVLSAFVLGASFSSIITIAYHFKLYIIPLAVIQNQFFSTIGSTFQQVLYLIPVFVFSLIYTFQKINFPRVRVKEAMNDYGFLIQFIALLAVGGGILVMLYGILFLPNKPILLPYVYGFQTAAASLSQDVSRFIFALLAGSGYGTFSIDFTRFRLPSFNLEQNIWNLSFSYSSSYLLELIATTGLLGILSYLYMVVAFIKSRSLSNPLFPAIFVAFVLSIISPFSYILVVELFALLGIYITFLNIYGDKNVYDITLSLVASKRGMLSFEATPEGERPARAESPAFSIVVFAILVFIAGFVCYYTFKFALSDMQFAESLRAAQQNDGKKTYEKQTAAIKNFSYRGEYHRIFSQVNLSLANSLTQGIKPGSSPSAQLQQNVTTLLQQSINSARNAVVISPQNSLNWQNLGAIYRALINVGQNASEFSIASMNNAIALDPYNPSLYIQLGGIYYQQGRYDDAIGRFQVAINLKRDFANAYYNLGHAYESKADLKQALTAYQVVRQLSVNNKENIEKIDSEIKALQDKIGAEGKQTNIVRPETEQTPLNLSTSTTVLPTQKPPIKISPPPGETAATESAQ